MLHVVHPRPFVSVASIDRPEQRNAVDQETLKRISVALSTAVAEGDRVFILAGRGSTFSAGADLRGIGHEGFSKELAGVLRSLATAPVVTLACVEGAALGAGTQLAAFCDLRIASERARFGIPAGKLGLAVDQATVARVVELCGGAVARRMLFTAEPLSVEEALSGGFVSRRGGLEEAIAWSEEIARLAPLSAMAHKAMLAQLGGMGSSAVAAEAHAAAWASTDHEEGRTAFLERRDPVFRGK